MLRCIFTPSSYYAPCSKAKCVALFGMTSRRHFTQHFHAVSQLTDGSLSPKGTRGAPPVVWLKLHVLELRETLKSARLISIPVHSYTYSPVKSEIAFAFAFSRTRCPCKDIREEVTTMEPSAAKNHDCGCEGGTRGLSMFRFWFLGHAVCESILERW